MRAWLGVGLISIELAGCAGSSMATAPDEPAALYEQELAPSTAEKGPLVLAVVVDQLGSETLTKLEPLLDAEGAFARARSRGRVFRRVVYGYGATLTAPGHAAIFSGAAPAESGVAANARVERSDFQRYDFVDDRTHAILGAPGRFASPALMRTDTVADALKAQTGAQAKVVALSVKDRGVVFTSRRPVDLALWYEPAARGFTTSTFYASELPQWVIEHNRKHPPNLAAEWRVADEARLLAQLGPDAAAGEGPPPGLSNAFPHRLATSKRPADDWTLFPDSTDALLELALVARGEVGLCADAIPDLLAISISAPDLVGHRFGPGSWEYAESIRHADAAVARFVERLERDCTVSVLITSDHGVAPLPEQSGAKRVDGLQEKVEAQLDALLGDGDWTVRYDPPYLYLGPHGRAFRDAPRLRTALSVALGKIPGVLEAIDVRDRAALEARGDALARQVMASVDIETSGEIFVVLERGAVPSFGAEGVGTTHGSPYSYDTDVPVLLWGPGITPSIQLEPYDQARVASTLAALLAIEPPRAGAPEPLPGVAVP